MPLGTVPDNKEEIQKINDLLFDDHEGFPADETEAGTRWAEVVDVACSGVIPASSTTAAAKLTFAADLTAQLVAGSPTPFVIPFTNYALTVAGGMAPAYTGTPPPVAISFTSVYAIGNANEEGAAEDCAQEMASVINTWFKTGTAIISGGGPTLNWT